MVASFFSMAFKVAKTESNALAYTNHVYVSTHDAVKFQGSPYVLVKSADGKLIFNWSPLETAQPGEMQFNILHRRTLNISIGETVRVESYTPPKGEGIFLASVECEVGFMQTKKADSRTYKLEQLEAIFQSQFEKQVLSLGQELLLDVSGSTLVFRVCRLESFVVDEFTHPDCGILMAKTATTFVKAKDSTIKLGGQVKSAPMAFGPNFDFQKVGIGGLDKEFASIFRRAFASRVYPPEVVQSLGIMHVKGILLYGPPGTGKTLIARKIGEMLNSRPPKLVNGPEILNKYVGQSEENIRALFAEAELEYKEKGDESELHIIIFDEIDAICKERGSRSGGGTGVGDSMVNQLLSKLDGVEQINNVLVIGMTNRKDMIDEALLRPGRLEVHMEIGLPDETGRVQILTIHTAKMRTNGFLADDVSLEELARETKNFSGAEIGGLVKSATSFALNRNVDATLHNPDKTKIKVTREDFFSALSEVTPAFGAAEDMLTAAVPNGIIAYGSEFTQLFNGGKLFIEQVKNSERTPIISILLSGKSGSGKTALAAKLALESGFPYIKLLSPDHFIGYQESSRVMKINHAFEDAYKSKTSLIILDDVERFLEYTPIGPRFSNMTLQALIVLMRRTPPKGHKLLVIATTSCEYVMRELGFMDAVNSVLRIPSLNSGTHVRRVLRELGGFSKTDLEEIDGGWTGEIEMKRLIMIAEMAKQAHSHPDGGKESLGKQFLALRKLE